jgi:hypothetical protein
MCSDAVKAAKCVTENRQDRVDIAASRELVVTPAPRLYTR